MRNIVFAAIALCTLAIPASAQVREWKAVAIVDDPDPRLYWGTFAWGATEEQARSRAITECELQSGRTCRRNRTSSVPASWYLVVSSCRGKITSGGSQYDQWAANTRAGMKLGQSDGRGCSLRETYWPE